MEAGARPVITRLVDGNRTIRLPNTTHPLIQIARDQGRVAGDLPMERVVLMLKSSVEQEAALEQLLNDQQSPTSPRYHQWLTPKQFGERFGASIEDINVITDWLRGHGFQILNVANGRRNILFNGTARQIENAFHTTIHHYEVAGERHTANATDISIPEALIPVVAGIASLHDFSPQRVRQTDGAEVNFTNGNHGMTPYDFATIYNVAPLWNEGFDGSGQTIAIVGRTNISIDDVAAFRAAFGLPANNPQVVINGSDPGIVSGQDEGEALLDVKWSGAVAKGAAIKLVVTGNTNATPGILGSAQYIVDNSIGSIISVSFGGCEGLYPPNGRLFWSNTWQQAAAEGISVFVSSGDSGSAGCETNRDSPSAYTGLGVNVVASTPYNVAVGGTQFNENGADSVYWNDTSDRSNGSSAKIYIPEMVWNESAALGGSGLWSSGGGVSSLWPTPSWQSGYGVPTTDPGTADGHHRYLPDVSLSAAGHDAYAVGRTNDGRYTLAYGTSAAAPAFAGIMAIVNQVTKQANGNPNPGLYGLAAAHYQDVFHDISQGSNAVPCADPSPDCVGGMMTGYNAAPGYDLATGWGSVNAYNLAHLWPGAPPSGNITASPNPCIATSGSSCTSTITWSTQSVNSALVGVSVNGGAEAAFSGALSGSISAPWIMPGNQYKFVLYNLDTNNALSSVTVTAAKPTGTITASPNPCTITSGTSCATRITWSTQYVSAASVRLSVNGGPESEGAHSLSGSLSAPIAAGSQYRFALYNLDAGTLLGSVTVTAISSTPAAAHLALSGNLSWQQSGNTVKIHVDRISNTGSATSGSIRFRLWATAVPYVGRSISGYVLGVYQFSQALGPNQYYSGISESIPFLAPPAGTYYTTLALEEYIGSDWFIQDYLTFSSTETWGLAMSGNTSWQASGSGVTIHVDQISNTSSSTTGSIRLRLWATASRYSGGVISGYVLGSYQFALVLGPNQSYSGVTQTVPFSRPPAGTYYTTLTLEEYTGTDWVIRGYLTYISTQTF